MSTIDKLMVGQPIDAFSDDYFVNVILRSHINYIFTYNLYRVLNIEPLDFYKYRGDFYGLLDKYDIPKKYHSFILRLNGGTDTATFLFGNKNQIYIPDLGTLDQLATTYSTNNTTFI